MRDAIILIFANKQDLEDGKSENYLKKKTKNVNNFFKL